MDLLGLDQDVRERDKLGGGIGLDSGIVLETDTAVDIFIHISQQTDKYKSVHVAISQLRGREASYSLVDGRARIRSMANNVQQAVVATAEPQECSRWAVIFLLGSAGATIVCFTLCLLVGQVGSLDSLPPLLGLLGPPLAMLFMLVGISLFSLGFILFTEQFTGGNPYGVMNVDWLLSL
jgi:hypothetical protein